MTPSTHINPTSLLGDRPGIPPMAQLPEGEVIDVQELLRRYEEGEIDLICVVGPTASGKTRYAVGLAREINRLRGMRSASPEGALSEKALSVKAGAEILSADSRQVYLGMDIGTGKDLGEYGEIPYHLIDIVPAGTKFNIFEYQRAFEVAYQDIRNRGGVPVLCGGSGLYVEAATCGYHLPEVPPDPEFRSHLEAEDAAELRAELLRLRPETSEGVMQSKRRIIRALEVAHYEAQHPVVWSAALPKKAYFIGTLVSREGRVARIDRRLDERLSGGMVEEVRGLLAQGIPYEDLMYYGLEYKFVTQYIKGILSYEDMRTLLANAIHQFAKRQMTWFRGMERDGHIIHWTSI